MISEFAQQTESAGSARLAGSPAARNKIPKTRRSQRGENATTGEHGLTQNWDNSRAVICSPADHFVDIIKKALISVGAKRKTLRCANENGIIIA